MDFDPLILSNHFCTNFINLRPFSTFFYTSSISTHLIVFFMWIVVMPLVVMRL